MFNWEIIGHKKIIHFLETCIQRDNLSQGYLFYGPKSIGKHTLIRRFILNLMCFNADENKSEIPCMRCEQCRQINKNIHSDVMWIKKEADKKNITVEQIRNLQESLAVHSFFKLYKIAVIENAENLSLAAANALLKTLEEPTSKTILILLAERINRLPKTVLSRVQKIKFLAVSQKEIYDNLLELGAERELANCLAKIQC